VVARKPDQVRVERLGEPGIGDRGRQALAASMSAAFSASAEARAVRQDRDLVPSRTIRPLPISSGSSALGHIDADAFAARIAECDRAGRRSRSGRTMWPVPPRRRRHQTMPGRRRDSDDVEAAGMGRPVGADQARRGRWRSAPAGFWIATSCTT
jgi:hypothetical protein